MTLQATVKQCERCAKRCRCATERSKDADLFVKGTAETGRFCAECVTVDFLVNCDMGPQITDLFRKQSFNPRSLLLPHVQAIVRQIVEMAVDRFGAELTFDEIDWDEVVANWHLPFPKKKRSRKKK